MFHCRIYNRILLGETTMTLTEKVNLHLNLKDFIEKTADQYCESLTEQEFRWLVDGLTDKLREYLKNKMEKL